MYSVLYTPDKSYDLVNSCYGQVSAPPIQFTTPGYIQGGLAVSLDNGTEINSLAQIIDLVKHEQVCTHTTLINGNASTYFWWNEDKLLQDFQGSQRGRSVFCPASRDFPICGKLAVPC